MRFDPSERWYSIGTERGRQPEVDVLSDRERIVLDDIERKLGDEDPELAERLTGAGSGESTPHWRYWVAAAVLGLFILISIGADMPIATLALTMALSGVVAVGYFRTRRPNGR